MACNGFHLHSRVGIAADSLNKPWAERANTRWLVNPLPMTSCHLTCRTNANLTEIVPAKLLCHWVEISRKQSSLNRLNSGLIQEKKKCLEISSLWNLPNVSFTFRNICYLTAWRASDTTTLAGLTGVPNIPVKTKAVTERITQALATKSPNSTWSQNDGAGCRWRMACSRSGLWLPTQDENLIVMMKDSGARVTSPSHSAGMREICWPRTDVS